MFPWEVDSKIINEFYIGPYLFSALYRVYKGAYEGQGFNFYGKPIKLSPNFQTFFNALPIDVKRIVLAKVWVKGVDFKTLLIVKGKLFLDYKLHFLFTQYGRLKNITQPIYSIGCGVWSGYKVNIHTYHFTYGPRDPIGKFLIPEFLNSESQKTRALLCP